MRMLLGIIFTISFFVGLIYGWQRPAASLIVLPQTGSFIGIISAASIAVFGILASRNIDGKHDDHELALRIRSSLKVEREQLAVQQLVVFYILLIAAITSFITLSVCNGTSPSSSVCRGLTALSSALTCIAFAISFALPWLLMKLVTTSRPE